MRSEAHRAHRRAVAGKGDGRVSGIGHWALSDDAKVLFAAVQDHDDYTDIEKNPVKYIRENYKFTVEADGWFRTEVRKWTATKGH